MSDNAEEQELPPVPSRPDAIVTARKVVAQYHPKAEVAFVAGSVVRGEADEGSDLDIVVIYAGDAQGPRRHAVSHEGWPVEMVVYDLKSSDLHIDSDARRGMPALPAMIAEGVLLTGPSVLADTRKTRAVAVLAAGPPALQREEIDMRRYMLTELLDEIEGGTRQDRPVMMSLALLYQDLADFYLRAHGKWSGRGKALFRALEASFPDAARRYEAAFVVAFSLEGVHEVLALADDMLKPFGGRSWQSRTDAPKE
jgi:hypothetical protein